MATTDTGHGKSTEKMDISSPPKHSPRTNYLHVAPMISSPMSCRLNANRISSPVSPLVQRRPRPCSRRHEDLGSVWMEAGFADTAGVVHSSENLPEEPPPVHARLSRRCSLTSMELQACAMLEASSTQGEFAEELVCSVCLELFRKPVLLQCGHSFCQTCIDAVCVNKTTTSCPFCRATFEKGKYIRNVALDNLAEKVRAGSPVTRKRTRSNDLIDPQGQCRDHQEKFKLFCKDDGFLLCLVCRYSPKHTDHTFLPIEDAVSMFKGQLSEGLVKLKATKCKSEERRRKQQRLVENQNREVLDARHNIAAMFKRLHGIVMDRKVMVDELQIQEGRIKKKMDDGLVRLQEHRRKVQETLETAQNHLDEEDPFDFLKGIKSCLQKCSKEHLGRDPTTEVFRTQFPQLPKGPLEYMIWKQLKYRLSPDLSQLTLDPHTAHRELTVSGDNISMWYSGSKGWLWEHHKRFDGARAVLASEGFTSGEHYWEVHMGRAASWVIGVAKESINRVEDVPLVPSSGLWVLVLKEFQTFQRLGTAKTSSKVVPSISRSQKVGVYLDYENGVLSFYNATNMSHIHSLHFLTKSRLFPYFRLCADGTEISELLTICY